MTRPPEIRVFQHRRDGHSGEAGLRCPYCRDAIEPGPLVRCPDCALTLHAECAGELDGCPSLGCSGLPSSSTAEALERQRLRVELWRFQPVDLPCRIETSPRASGLVLNSAEVFSSRLQSTFERFRGLPGVVVLMLALVAIVTQSAAVLVFLICLALALLGSWLIQPFMRLTEIERQLRGESRGRLRAVRSLARELRLELEAPRSSGVLILTFPPGREARARVDDEDGEPRLVIGEVKASLPPGWSPAMAESLAGELNRVRRAQEA